MINKICAVCETVTTKGALIDAVENCEDCKAKANAELIQFYRETPVRWRASEYPIQETLRAMRDTKPEWYTL